MGAGGGGELQVTVAVDAGDGGAEWEAVVDVVGFDTEAIEALQVVVTDSVGTGGVAQLAVAAQDVVKNCAKEGVEVEGVAERRAFEQQ